MSRATSKQAEHAPPLLPSGEDRPLELDLDEVAQRQIVARLVSRDYDDWSQALSRVGFCANPIRLVGRSEAFDTTTGALIRTYGSADETLGVTFTRCGNRRADKCESCSRLYAADTFQLIRAGVAGGKTVPRRWRTTRWSSRPSPPPPSARSTEPARTAVGAGPGATPATAAPTGARRPA